MNGDAIQLKVLRFLDLTLWVNLNSTFPELENMIARIRQDSDYYFKQKIIKRGVATTVGQAKIGEQDIIIKRINPQSLLTVVRRLFCFSRVKRNWRFAHLLAQHEIDTFRPIMMVTKKYCGLAYITYLYMTKVEGLTAVAYFEKYAQQAQWQSIADKIIQLIKKLNRLGLRHRDLNLSNMIIGQDKVFLIDLDAMKYEKKMNSKLCNKEIDKFIENIDYLKQQNIELYQYFCHGLC